MTTTCNANAHWDVQCCEEAMWRVQGPPASEMDVDGHEVDVSYYDLCDFHSLTDLRDDIIDGVRFQWILLNQCQIVGCEEDGVFVHTRTSPHTGYKTTVLYCDKHSLRQCEKGIWDDISWANPPKVLAA